MDDAVRQYAPFILFMSDWHRGMFHMSMTEYTQMSAATHKAMQVYRAFIDDRRQEQQAKQ